MKYFKWLLLTPQDITKILGRRRRDRAVEFVLNDHKCRTAVLIGLEGRLRGNATAKTANILKRELRQFNGHTGRWDTKEGILHSVIEAKKGMAKLSLKGWFPGNGAEWHNPAWTSQEDLSVAEQQSREAAKRGRDDRRLKRPEQTGYM